MSLDDKKRKASKMNMEEDPLVLENRRLAQEVDQLRAKLAEYATNSNRATVDQLEQEIAELKKKLADYEDDASDDDDDHESVCDGSAWSVKYFSLKQYKQEHGDCKVPQKYPELGKWVMNMRAAFKNKKIPQDKIDKLNKVSFNWGKGFPDPPSWEDNFQELKKYHDKFGHWNIYIDTNPALQTEIAKWVMEQRKQGKKLQKMKPSAMTMDQYEQLQGLSFKWKVAKRHS